MEKSEWEIQRDEKQKGLHFFMDSRNGQSVIVEGRMKEFIELKKNWAAECFII